MRTLDDTMPGEPRGIEGTQLGPYRIECLLGEGAMGEVYRAVHGSLRRMVAIKTLKPGVAADRTSTERFFAEARAVNIIRHENIVECTDLVDDPGGRSYIVMELLEGRTLGDAIREACRLPLERAAHIVAQIADAIGAAHAKGIVHRDLKPENIFLIRRAGSSDYVKVLDFGIARLRPELGGVAVTQTGALIGTPAYMSPEQVNGEKAGPASDIYAVGVILFYMLTGRQPFETESMPVLLVSKLQETPPRVDSLVPTIPIAMTDLVARCLARAPGDRPADMAALRRAVLAAAELADGIAGPAPILEVTDPAATRLAQAAPNTGAEHEARRHKPRRWLLVAGGVVALAAGAILIVRSVTSEPSTTPEPAPPASIEPARTEQSPTPAGSAQHINVDPVRILNEAKQALEETKALQLKYDEQRKLDRENAARDRAKPPPLPIDRRSLPGGYACYPGKFAAGIGCECPAGYRRGRDNQQFEICVKG